jgi:hypothetical protein
MGWVSFMVWSCSSLLRANDHLLLRRQGAGDWQQQTTLAQGRWIAFLGSVCRLVLDSGAVGLIRDACWCG